MSTSALPIDAANGREAPWAAAASRRTFRYLRCLACGRDEAADLVQETLVAAVATWREAEPPLPWLFATARNLWFARCRARHREVEGLRVLHERAVRELGPDGGDGDVERLRRCVAALPERSRRVLELVYRDGGTRRSAARSLGLREEGVKSLLGRVRSSKGCSGRSRRSSCGGSRSR